MRPLVTAAAVLAAAVAASACEEGTVSIRFAPAIGDRYEVRSQFRTTVERRVGGEVEEDTDTTQLDVRETVLAVDDEAVSVAVTATRDDATPRRYEARYDRTSRLAGIDLVEGVPATSLGIDVTAGLPTDLFSPPEGPLAPGQTWTIDRSVQLSGDDDEVRITGEGRLRALGLDGDVEIAIVEIEVEVPVSTTVDGTDGRVTLSGVQRVVSETTYGLADGSTRDDRTTITGEVDLVLEPPPGVVSPPIDGELRYVVRTTTERRLAS